MTESKSQHQHRLNQLGKLVDEELEDERSGKDPDPTRQEALDVRLEDLDDAVHDEISAESQVDARVSDDPLAHS